MTTPVVLVAGHRREVETPFGSLSACLVYEPYLYRLEAAGCVPLIGWPVRRVPHRVLEAVSGILLVGGGDVAPGRFGSEEPAEAVDHDRDRFEIDLVRAARERRVPVLALCRGVQVLNVAFGGTLETVPGHRMSADPSHRVEVERDTRLAKLVGETLEVNSFHRWAVGRVAEGLVPVARAPDGTIEAIEGADDWFAMGVQWHPELLEAEETTRLFEELARHTRVEGGLG